MKYVFKMRVSEKTTHLVSLLIKCLTLVEMYVKYAVRAQFAIISKAFHTGPVSTSSNEVSIRKNHIFAKNSMHVQFINQQEKTVNHVDLTNV